MIEANAQANTKYRGEQESAGPVSTQPYEKLSPHFGQKMREAFSHMCGYCVYSAFVVN